MSLELINRVVELTNIERSKVGLQPVTLDLQLADAAQNHSDDMASDDFFSHTGADGSTPVTRIADRGYDYAAAGENIAAGQTRAEQVVEGWMNSPGHRANILNESFTEIGIGYTYLANDTGSVNYNHYWTQVFGKPLNSTNSNASPDPVPESSIEQSSPIEASDNNNISDSNFNLLPVSEEFESSPDKISELALPEEVESSDSAIETQNQLEVEQPDLITESNLESEVNTNPLAPIPEIDNGEQPNPGQNESDRVLNLDDFSLMMAEYTSDLSGGTAGSVLAGGDASDFIYVETSTSTDGKNNIRFDYLLELSKPLLGMAAEGQASCDSWDTIEYDSSSRWTEAKQNFLQSIAESFL